MSLFGVLCMYSLSLLDVDPGDDDLEVLVLQVCVKRKTPSWAVLSCN